MHFSSPVCATDAIPDGADDINDSAVYNHASEEVLPTSKVPYEDVNTRFVFPEEMHTVTLTKVNHSLFLLLIN